MKKSLRLSIFALLVGMVVVSCSKSMDEPVQETPVVKSTSPVDFLKTPEGNSMFAQVIQDYMAEHPQLKSTEFILPFFTSDGFGVAKDIEIDCEVPWLPPGVCLIVGGELGFFSSEYGPNDFWKVNPDGTTSVHMSSKTASAVHINFGTGEFSTGQDCKLNLNYTGVFTEATYIDFFTGEEVTYYFIDLENSPNAAMMHGNGKVQAFGGPMKNLVAKSVSTPGGPYNTTLNIN